MGEQYRKRKPFSGSGTLDELVQELNEESKLKLTCYDFVYKGKHYQMVQDLLSLNNQRQIRVFWFPENEEGLGIDANGNSIENNLKIYDTGDYRKPLENYILHDGTPLVEALKMPGLIILD